MIVALIYDFDGTLSPGNMQEYDFIPAVGKEKSAFWAECEGRAKEQDVDSVLTYMNLMIRQAQSNQVSLSRESFRRFGAKVPLYPGVEQWFDRIDRYGASLGITIEHYVNSSGIKEMIEGSPIAHHFKKIFASSFLYNVDGVAEWPGVAVNYTNKTQFIFKICKGIDNVYDSTEVNRYVPEKDQHVAFRHMIYLGDGTTDIPCMRLIKEKQGHSIAVHNPEDRAIGQSLRRLVDDHRVNFVAPADYSEGGRIDDIVKAVLHKIVADRRLKQIREEYRID